MKNGTYTLTAMLLLTGLVLAACSEPSDNEAETANITASAPATPGTDKSAAQAEAFVERPPSARLPGDPLDGSDIDAQSQQAFVALDENDDGLISTEEAATEEKLTQRWEALDSDADNKLDAVEFSKFEMPNEGDASAANSQQYKEN